MLDTFALNVLEQVPTVTANYCDAMVIVIKPPSPPPGYHAACLYF